MKRLLGGVDTRSQRRRTGRIVDDQRYRRAIARVDQPGNHPRSRLHIVERILDADDDSDEDLSDVEREDSDGFPFFLPQDEAPIEVDRTRSNLYIYPKQVLDFLGQHRELRDRNNDLVLSKLKDLFDDLRREDVPFPDRGYLNFNRDGLEGEELHNFIASVYRCLRLYGEYSNKWQFPFISASDVDETQLDIPVKDVLDLPVYAMMFILHHLASMSRRPCTILYSIGLTGNRGENEVFHTIERDNGSPITIKNGKVSLKDLGRLFLTIFTNFARLMPGEESSSISWNGSEDSGTRIMLNHFVGNNAQRIYVKLKCVPVASINRAHGWSQKVEDMIADSIGTTVMSVRNRDDNKCLLYCIVLGMIMKIKGCGRVFGKDDFMLEPAEIYCKGMYLFTDDDPYSVLLRRLTRYLLPPVYSEGEADPMIPFLEDLDKKAGTMLSVSEFREEFADIEKKLFPDKNVGIDVYGIDMNINTHVYPLYISKNRDKIIELLCVTPLDTRCSHYCLIVNMEKLMRQSGGKQFFSCTKCGQCFYHRRLLSEHKCPFEADVHAVGGEGGYHYACINADPRCDIIYGSCPKCRLCFINEFTYEYHKKHCLMEGQTGYRHVQLVSYTPGEHPMLKGEEIDISSEEKHVKRRRILYADFECSINPETGVHTFMSYGIFDWGTDTYKCGYDLKEFMDWVIKVSYEGNEDQIYIYFHNAMGYDANFILRYILSKPEYSKWGIQVIMKSSNRLQKLVLHTHQNNKSRTIHIGDTFLFLTLSLEKIVDSIRKDDIERNKENFYKFFKVFHIMYPEVRDEEIDHILRKNIFPYKFFTDNTKLETSHDEFLSIFEPKEENLQYFSERVTLEDLAKNFEDVRHVMEVFECKTAKDYHDLYLCCDVMQLSDVFNRSMEILWESHHIHLTRYLGMPSASWAAFLRHDPKMQIPLYEETFFAEFFKGMIRGGITSAALRHATADSTHSIIYLDVNGLYPFVMQAYKFPCGTFEFVPLGWRGECVKLRLQEQFKKLEDMGKGMCFCVDLTIPDDVKRMTDMYPFAPEHRRIYKEYYTDLDKKELTPFLKKWSTANNDEMMKEFNGLVCTLYDKEKYNVHWRLLKFYMEHGVIVKKVYFGVMFDEGDYLAGYIRKNIEIRNTRKDELGKTLYKLLGNSIYGKTFESPFKRNTYEIIRDKVKLQGMLEEGNIATVVPIDDLGWIVKMDGEDIILDKPTYIGACVCEFSKLHMYTLLYDKLMKIFPDGCELVYTDTDSFIVRVTHSAGLGDNPEDLFAYIKSIDPELIGGIGGQVKSETGEDDTIQEVIALRSKVYAYITKKGHIGKRAKGTTHDAQEMQLDWETYKSALESLTSINTLNMQFVRNTFKISSLNVERQSLSVNDGKRYICEDGIHTHAFGYCF